ncbi:MAG TPA: hypothetical protein VKU89_04275 [Solirubrobacteraceae bacterium]|nr:hypothetical protein [Solirubrobacteraceae bacterium]
MADSNSGERYLREWIGEIIGAFARGSPSVTEEDLIDAVEAELILGATSVAEVFDPQNRRIAELFCTP